MKIRVSKRLKLLVAILTILLFFILIEQIPAVQRLTAQISAQTYVLIKFGNELSFVEVEYAPQFGDYFVFFDRSNGERISFMMSPKFFPIIVSNHTL